jgi:hypothetical protein
MAAPFAPQNLPKPEYFVNDGHGFHSNDARGTVTAKAPHDAVTCVGAVGERGQFVRPTSF